MRKHRYINYLFYLLIGIVVLPTLSGCDSEDDVVAIFTGKTWKLTYIAMEGSNKQFDFWNGNEAARENSMKALAVEDNFTLIFEGTDLNTSTGGSINGKAISATITGQWTANGENQKLTITPRVNGSEKDVFAKAFLEGLQNAVKYSGDEDNLFIHYKDGQTTKFMGLKPQKIK